MRSSGNRLYLFVAVIFFIMIFDSGFANARDLKAGMVYLPKILETPDKGGYVDIVKAIDEVYEGNIRRKVYPVKRAMANLISGKTDFHMPMIKNKIVPVDSLPYAYTTEKSGDVCFVIYSHKDNPITRKSIEAAKGKKTFPLEIETIGVILNHFDFPIKLSSGVDSSLKQVNSKRIDAYIMGQDECDILVKQLKLKNIHREIYDYFEDAYAIPKGDKGKEIDKIISGCLKKLRSTGKLQNLYRKVHLPFQEWQPHEMGW